ncbi:MAG TPA: carbamoyltransferase C-terminal domain-containing protein [Gemmatimonadaceae bacterium]|nr:carbamoyltransferase C-terminal domain-containing protein [Gemmatimonadaceae bacterium]
MRTLGLTTEGDSGAAIVEDGRLLAAVNEERLCRMKMVMGIPRDAIAEVCRVSGTTIQDLDAVLVASTRDLLVDAHEPFDGWFQHRAGGVGGVVKRAADTFSRYHARMPALERAYYGLLAPSFAYRRHAIRRILRTEFGVRCPIIFVDHHLAHVASAYFTSGFTNALVMSVDGGGDGRSSLIYAVRDGRFEYLHETSAFNSLGNYYAYVTHLCGFKAMKHEGKVTGLAAYGEPRYLPILRALIDEQGGTLVNRGLVFRAAIADLQRRLPAGWTREDLAATIQAHVEDVMRRYVDHWARRTGLRHLAAAGGVFANVRVNEEVHGLPSIDRVFIHPHMGDGGLSAGAALAACIPGILPATMPRDPAPLPHVWLSARMTETDIAHALRSHQLEPAAGQGPMDERIAELLAQGYVVARATGSAPYGPRALGNRSILYQPTDRSVNDWLNTNLHRTEFMPFAPSVLYEERDRCFLDVDGAEHAAEFMTLTFHCTPWMRRHLQGVVHVDGTARPQLVCRDRNPEYYAIIAAFHRRTGLPAIVNTSFNMHEEPIVYSADDAVRGFLAGHLDFLAIGSHLVAHPQAVTHPLHPVTTAPERLPYGVATESEPSSAA